ncbi:hypothetical protein DFP72DRAFT_846808 [Ephemerocybe angulata]|uniref:Uncharacterized protein n=1 Tax=Ephemerocybe angulata TaxID=980116 RepID=A0A8H6I277_9AGAR|nr:hypothetical protein DFP72DRAFT_846808 [Tulosesus angulatus]
MFNTSDYNHTRYRIHSAVSPGLKDCLTSFIAFFKSGDICSRHVFSVPPRRAKGASAFSQLRLFKCNQRARQEDKALEQGLTPRKVVSAPELPHPLGRAGFRRHPEALKSQARVFLSKTTFRRSEAVPPSMDVCTRVVGRLVDAGNGSAGRRQSTRPHERTLSPLGAHRPQRPPLNEGRSRRGYEGDVLKHGLRSLDDASPGVRWGECLDCRRDGDGGGYGGEGGAGRYGGRG